MIELKPGVFIGSLSQLVIEKLWAKITKELKSGGAFLITPTNNEQNFEITYSGKLQRSIVDFDGIKLVKFPIKSSKKYQHTFTSPIKPTRSTSTSTPTSTSTSTPTSMSNQYHPNHSTDSTTPSVPIDSLSTLTNTFTSRPNTYSPHINQNSIDPSHNTINSTTPQSQLSQPAQHTLPSQPSLTLQPPTLTHNLKSSLTPPNFVIRLAKSSFINKSFSLSYSGISTYPHIPSNQIWNKYFSKDIDLFAKSLLSISSSIPHSKLVSSNLLNSTISSIDIETPDSIPLAYQGQICIIGISSLTFPPEPSSKPTYSLLQIFDLSEPPFRPNLTLQLSLPTISHSSPLIVFNQKFDISIIQSVISKFNLNLHLPTPIIDLKNDFINLIELENFLYSKLFIKRYTTNKNKYPEYYKIFRENPNNLEYNQLEPIGTYNAIDTLSPMIAHILIKYMEN